MCEKCHFGYAITIFNVCGQKVKSTSSSGFNVSNCPLQSETRRVFRRHAACEQPYKILSCLVCDLLYFNYNLNQSSCSYQEDVRQSSVSRQAVITQSSGSRRAVVRQSLCSRQAVIWQSSSSNQTFILSCIAEPKGQKVFQVLLICILNSRPATYSQALRVNFSPMSPKLLLTYPHREEDRGIALASLFLRSLSAEKK